MPHRPCLLEANQAYHVTWKVQNDEFRLVHDADIKVLEALMIVYLISHDVRITAKNPHPALSQRERVNFADPQSGGGGEGA